MGGAGTVKVRSPSQPEPLRGGAPSRPVFKSLPILDLAPAASSSSSPTSTSLYHCQKTRVVLYFGHGLCGLGLNLASISY